MNPMLKKYSPIFILQILSNALWGYWVLPSVGEQGTAPEMIRWMGMQIALPFLLGVLLSRKRRYAFWLLILYAALIILFGLGMFGWALMGPSTPMSVYIVCGLFFVVGFWALFQSMKDLGIGQKPRQYGLDE